MTETTDMTIIRAKLKEMLIDGASVIISINGKRYWIPLREAKQIARDERITVQELTKKEFEITETEH